MNPLFHGIGQPEVITSTSNPRIKNLAALSRGSRARREDVIVVEGIREISRALDGGYSVRELYVFEGCLAEQEINGLINRAERSGARVFAVSDRVMEKISYRDSRASLVALTDRRPMSLSLMLEQVFERNPEPLLLVLEAPEKPGNVGAILRTCDGGGVDGVIVCDPSCDPFSANAVRSSLGCVFTVPCCVASGQETMSELRRRGVRVLSTTPAGRSSIWQCDMKGAVALAMGSEKDGLTDFWLKNSDQTLVIPMRGYADSLNLSTSTAIVVFEALRQRFA